MRASGVLRAPGGRLRLGWRLLAFPLLAIAVMATVALLLPTGMLTVSGAMLAGGLVAGWALLALDGRGPAALGFHASRAAVPEAAKGFGLGVALGLGVVAAIAALGGLRWTAESGTAVGWLASGAGALAFLALPAAAEEAVLRGYPLQALSEAWGPGPALVLTSAAFAGLHVWNPGVTTLGIVNVAVAGAFLGVVYLKTASLWWASGAHLGWNWSHGFLVDVPVSGLELLDAPFYEGTTFGPTWLGGGPFGPEGSAVASVLVVAAAWVCWRTRALRPGEEALRAGPIAFAPAGDTTTPRAGVESARDGGRR